MQAKLKKKAQMEIVLYLITRISFDLNLIFMSD